jgi:hypothetical protein
MPQNVIFENMSQTWCLRPIITSTQEAKSEGLWFEAIRAKKVSEILFQQTSQLWGHVIIMPAMWEA